MKPSPDQLRYAPNLSLLTARAVELIWNRYPGYSDDNFSKDELLPSVNGNVALAIRVIRRGQTPSFEELRERRGLGSQRARQSVPLESVIQAYRCTERVILLDLFSDSRRWPVELTSYYADLIISTFDRLTQEIVDSYRETVSAMQAARQLVEHDLVLGLAGGYPPAQDDLNRWTLTLEVDPEAPYTAVAVEPLHPLDQFETQELRRWLAATLQPVSAGTVLIGNTAARTFGIFSPMATHTQVVRALASALESRTEGHRMSIGVGQQSTNLIGATVSCSQAQDAARVARAHRRPALSYREVMLDVLLLRQHDISAEIADTRLAGLDKHPHLIDTVRSLIRNNHSQSAVSRDMYIHLNTVSHRLKRVHELTGYDPLVIADLLQLAVALSWKDLASGEAEEDLTR